MSGPWRSCCAFVYPLTHSGIRPVPLAPVIGTLPKFSFEANYGMISLHDQQCIIEEHDDGDQFQRGPFPPRDYPDGGALVCRLPTQHAPRRRTHGGTWGPHVDHSTINRWVIKY